MTKEDWIQLFKEINGRAPESKEIEAAINMGTIKEGAAPLASRQETDSKEGPQVAPLAKQLLPSQIKACLRMTLARRRRQVLTQRA